MTRLVPPCAVRHIDGRTGQLLSIFLGADGLPWGLVRFGRQEHNGQGPGEDSKLPLGYLEAVGSKDMD